MSSGERKRSLTSEIADETTKKNEFEERRLQRKLQELEELLVKQQKKRKEEQLEYALQNLALEDMGNFNVLTKKILRSSFLPPISRKGKERNSDSDGRTPENRRDMIAERLRGSKMIQRFTESRGPRNLTRTLSADSGMLSYSENHSENPQNVTEQRNNPPNHYSAFVKMHPGRRAISFTEFQTRDRSDEKVAGAISKDIVPARSVKTDTSLLMSRHKARNEAKGAGFVQNGRKVRHQCLSEALEYKLKMRESARKS